MLLIDEIAGTEARVLGDAVLNRPSISVRELLHMRVELERETAVEARAQTLRISRETLAGLGAARSGSREWRLNGPEKVFRAQMFIGDPADGLPSLTALLETAEKAFHQNRFFILLDDRQAESLDEVIEIDRTASATFFLLTPLQGG